MRRYVAIIALIGVMFSLPDVNAGVAEDFLNSLPAGDLIELTKIMAGVAASCALSGDFASIERAKKELLIILKGFVDPLAQLLVSEALAPGYPNACHVLTSKHLKSITEKKEKGSKCLHATIMGICLKSVPAYRPIVEYYWPMYFIEVAAKGNDSHGAFVDGNVIYDISRSIASGVGSLVDQSGPYTLLAMVTGGSLAGEILGLKLGGGDMAGAAKAMTMLPIEKARLRATYEKNQPTYEVNVWPVSIAKPLAESLAVCGDGNPMTNEGGIPWPGDLAGVPHTCPVAMAKDAFAYWDSGLLDYLNPDAIRGIAEASNPIACGIDQAASMLDNYGALGVGKQAGDQKAVNAGIKNAEVDTSGTNPPDGMDSDEMADAARQSLRSCSFPILGKAEAIAGSVVNASRAPFEGPWCTLWGPVAPRNSTTTYNADFAMANAALKFKLLAHELFGLARGDKERWSLAYPWETGTAKELGDILSDFTGVLGKVGIDITSLTKSSGGRSESLYVPGDPRLIDMSFSAKNLKRDTINLTKELTLMNLPAATLWNTLQGLYSGQTLVAGKKRVYTVWGRVSCKSKTRYIVLPFGIKQWEDCDEAIKFEVRKFVQKRILRRLCDYIFFSKAGEPFKD